MGIFLESFPTSQGGLQLLVGVALHRLGVLQPEALMKTEVVWRNGTTVDGQNPAPVDMVNIPLFAGFHTSKVVQDFVHQQYEPQK